MLHIRDWLMHRSFLILLLIVNVIGTIYGYIWYGRNYPKRQRFFFRLCLTAQQRVCSLFLF